MLHDRCPRCQQAIAYYEGGGVASFAGPRVLSLCATCGFDLAEAETTPLHVWDEDVYLRWRYALAKTESLQMGKDKWGYTIFPVLHQLCKVLTGQWRNNQLQSYAEAASGAGNMPFRLAAWGFENRSVAERHHLLGLAFWLLGKWPKQLVDAWGKGVVTYSTLIKDGKNVPSWYYEALIKMNRLLKD